MSKSMVPDIEEQLIASRRLIREQDNYCWRLKKDNKRLREALAWQPIETAPKDGTNIILATFTDPGVLVIQNDYWTEYRTIKFFQNEPEDDKIYGCWCNWPDGVTIGQPTHWKPIEPPALKEGGE